MSSRELNQLAEKLQRPADSLEALDSLTTAELHHLTDMVGHGYRRHRQELERDLSQSVSAPIRALLRLLRGARP